MCVLHIQKVVIRYCTTFEMCCDNEQGSVPLLGWPKLQKVRDNRENGTSSLALSIELVSSVKAISLYLIVIGLLETKGGLIGDI